MLLLLLLSVFLFVCSSSRLPVNRIDWKITRINVLLLLYFSYICFGFSKPHTQAPRGGSGSVDWWLTVAPWPENESIQRFQVTVIKSLSKRFTLLLLCQLAHRTGSGTLNGNLTLLSFNTCTFIYRHFLFNGQSTDCLPPVEYCCCY